MNDKKFSIPIRILITAVTALCCSVIASGCGGGGSDSGPCSTIGKAGKIAGGESCSDGQSSVALVLASTDTSLAECTGAYISTTAVLTAAHCFVFRPQEVSVVSNGFLRSGVSIAIHPLYDGAVGSPFDMAILRVDKPITSAPLPLLLSSSPSVGEEVVAYGYGTDQNGRESISRIQSGEAPLKATYSEYAGYRNGVVTIRSTGDGSPCTGDSGGPVVARSANGSYGIIGITVAGANGCSAEAGRPVNLASTQSQGAISFISERVPDVATN
jgi:hypothetical protein